MGFDSLQLHRKMTARERSFFMELAGVGSMRKGRSWECSAPRLVASLAGGTAAGSSFLLQLHRKTILSPP